MAERPVFIHSLFRTGSTFFWSLFRENPDYYCFYEPFHPVLADLTADRPFIWDSSEASAEVMKHPLLQRNKHAEYQKLLVSGNKGVPFFKKSFSIDEFCRIDEAACAKRYLDHLIECAGNRTPVFKFTRTSLRTEWFRKTYPNAAHIYLCRHPRDQWQSYVSTTPKKSPLFLTSILMTFGLNRQAEKLIAFLEHVPVPTYRARDFSKEEAFYRRVLNCYSMEEVYFLFYALWFLSFLNNVSWVDLFITMDLLAWDDGYRARIKNSLEDLGINGLRLKDVRIKSYTEHSLQNRTMELIEDSVQALALRNLSRQDIQQWFTKLQEAERNFFNFSQEAFSSVQTGDLNSWRPTQGKRVTLEGLIGQLHDECSECEKDLQTAFGNVRHLEAKKRELSDHIVQVEHMIAGKEVRIDELEKRLGDATRAIYEKDRVICELESWLNNQREIVSQIKASYSFKMGRLLLKPFSWLSRNR